MGRPRKVRLEGAEAIAAHVADPVVADPVPNHDASAAQSLAMRIWEGQSPDVPVIERVSRIANALKAQNLPLDIDLPHKDASRYLAAHQ